MNVELVYKKSKLITKCKRKKYAQPLISEIIKSKLEIKLVLKLKGNKKAFIP